MFLVEIHGCIGEQATVVFMVLLAEAHCGSCSLVYIFEAWCGGKESPQYSCVLFLSEFVIVKAVADETVLDTMHYHHGIITYNFWCTIA